MSTAAARRITPAEVLAAQERHPEVLLIRGAWARPLTDPERPPGVELMACPLGLLAIDAGADPWPAGRFGLAAVAAALGLDPDYVGAFAWAADGPFAVGGDHKRARQRLPIRKRQGIEDGRAVAAAVFGEEATP